MKKGMMSLEAIILLVVIVIAVAMFLYFYFGGQSIGQFIPFNQVQSQAIQAQIQACESNGGTVRTAMCCGAVSNFPNTCLIGGCGCAPQYSHLVSVCSCPRGQCWNGNQCILSPAYATSGAGNSTK